MNIKFLFEYLESQEKIMNNCGYNENYTGGYLDSISEIREYLKQTIELTKPKTTLSTGVELGVWANPANPNGSLPIITHDYTKLFTPEQQAEIDKFLEDNKELFEDLAKND